MVDLSIIIVNWNTCELLRQCLTAVYDHIKALDFEVWVVDNASTDGSQVMVRQQFPLLNVIENSDNLGFACANNQALRQVTTEYALLLNSDALVTTGSVEALMACATRHPDAGVCGAMLLNPDGSFQASYGSFPTLWSEFLHLFSIRTFFGDHNYPSVPLEKSIVDREVDWVGGACFLVRRKAWEAIGLLDESYEMYGEELDWCLRMWQSGWKVRYCPDAQVIHLGGQSTRSIPLWKMQQIYKSKLRYFEKHSGLSSRRILTSMIRLSCILKAGYSFLFKVFHPSSSAIKDWRLYWQIAWGKFSPSGRKP